MTRPEFGALLARCRRAAGLTQAQVGERLGVHPSAVGRWESGAMTLDALFRLLALYGAEVVLRPPSRPTP